MLKYRIVQFLFREDLIFFEDYKGLNNAAEKGKKMKAFATSCLIRDLADFKDGDLWYVISTGLKDSTKNLGQKYYGYKLYKQ
jgi:hypothetical protein